MRMLFLLLAANSAGAMADVLLYYPVTYLLILFFRIRTGGINKCSSFF